MASAPEPGGADRCAAAYVRFERLRWPDGAVTCPHCGSADRSRYLPPSEATGRRTRTGRVSARRLWRCNGCRRQFSVLTGTIFEGTRVPLASWADALDLAADGRASAAAIARLTGVRPETARSMAGLLGAGLDAARSTAQRQG